MISVRSAGCPYVGKHCAILSDAVNMPNVKLCIMVVLIELYPFIPLSVSE